MKRKVLMIIMSFMLMLQPLLASPVPECTAEGIILIEPQTNTILYGKNQYQQFYPASITKILTTYILLEEMKENQVITKSQNSIEIVPADSSHIGLSVGDQYTYKDGLYGIMLGSDNFIAHDMARTYSGSISSFATKMNETARKMGAKNTNFVNPHGYHATNHYTTPYDMAQIARRCFANETLKKIAGTTTYSFKVKNKGKSIPIKNSAKVIQPNSPYYNKNIVSVKTGYHSDAKQTIVAMAEYDHITLIAVVMKTSRPNQYTDLNKLLEYGAQNYSVTKNDKGSYELINRTGADWAKSYTDMAVRKGWIEDVGINLQQAISGIELKRLLSKALDGDQLISVYSKIERYEKRSTLTREEFANLIGDVSPEQAQKLRDTEPERAISYQEAICIVCRIII